MAEKGDKIYVISVMDNLVSRSNLIGVTLTKYDAGKALIERTAIDKEGKLSLSSWVEGEDQDFAYNGENSAYWIKYVSIH